MGNSASNHIEREESSDSSDELKKEELNQLNDSCKHKNIPYYFSDRLNLCSLCPIFIAYNSNNENDKDSKQRFVIKSIPNETEYEKFRIQEELKVIDRLSNDPNFIQFIDHFDLPYNNENYKFLVSYYYEDSDLHEFITKKDQITEKDICYIIYQMLEILQSLKNKKIVHNDIKLENFLMKSTSPPTILLTDFEFAEIINKSSCQCRGTVPYMAPEVLYNECHDYEADIWSLGICSFYLLFKKFPFNFERSRLYDRSRILESIENNELERPDIPVSDDAWNCVCQMLEKEQSDRITVEKALRLNWFKDVQLYNNEISKSTELVSFDDMKN